MEISYERPSGHIERGRALLDLERPEAAIDELQAALAEDPQSAEAECLMALAYAMLANYPIAELHVRNALTLDPDNAYSHYVYGMILQDSQRDGGAEREYLRAIHLLPVCADFHAAYAWLLYRNGQMDKAKKIARNALRFDPENVEALRLLGHLNMEEFDVDVAQATFQRALAINPESSGSHAGMGMAYLHRNQADKAAIELRESLRLEPNNPYAQELYLQSVKSRHRLYYLFWRWSLSLKRLGRTKAFFLIFGLWILINAITTMRQKMPEFFDRHPLADTAVLILVVLYILFCIYTWIADPLFNFCARRGWIK
ncbi:MAG: tetratricopeptide repeat protein [Candidatus Omnitrophota bacterium]